MTTATATKKTAPATKKTATATKKTASTRLVTRRKPAGKMAKTANDRIGHDATATFELCGKQWKTQRSATVPNYTDILALTEHGWTRRFSLADSRNNEPATREQVIESIKAAESRGTEAILFRGDCKEKMFDERIPEHSVDLVLCDPPFGVTANKWDEVIPFDVMWEGIDRVASENAVIVLFGKGEFFYNLVLSRPADKFKFSYEIIWDKNKGTNPHDAKEAFRASHESIAVFHRVGHFRSATYNPEKNPGETYKRVAQKTGIASRNWGTEHLRCAEAWAAEHKGEEMEGRFPLDIICMPIPSKKAEKPYLAKVAHGTQKPVELAQKLVRAFSNPGDTVMTFCMGSGTIGIAATLESRRFIGIELWDEYFDMARDRIVAAREDMGMSGRKA
jgi:DNA modification methylase